MILRINGCFPVLLMDRCLSWRCCVISCVVETIGLLVFRRNSWFDGLSTKGNRVSCCERDVRHFMPFPNAVTLKIP